MKKTSLVTLVFFSFFFMASNAYAAECTLEDDYLVTIYGEHLSFWGSSDCTRGIIHIRVICNINGRVIAQASERFHNNDFFFMLWLRECTAGTFISIEYMFQPYGLLDRLFRGSRKWNKLGAADQ